MRNRELSKDTRRVRNVLDEINMKYNIKKVNIFLCFIVLISTTLFVGCSTNYYDYTTLQEEYNELKEDYEQLQEEKKEYEELSDFLIDEIEIAEDRYDKYIQSVWENLFSTFTDNCIREIGESWNIGNDFSMYLVSSPINDPSIYCNFRLGDSAATTWESSVVSFFSTFIYTDEKYLSAGSSLKNYSIVTPDESGYYQGRIYRFSDDEDQDIYIDTIVSIKGETYATTFHYAI